MISEAACDGHRGGGGCAATVLPVSKPKKSGVVPNPVLSNFFSVNLFVLFLFVTHAIYPRIDATYVFCIH
jgi:hypothetical protein